TRHIHPPALHPALTCATSARRPAPLQHEPNRFILGRMYTAVLVLHSWLRWAVIVAALLVFIRGSRLVNSTTRVFTILLDVQLLLGLLLYVALSPFTRVAFQDMAAAMRDPGLRFWAVEHLTGMLLAVVAAHVGRARVR